MSNIPQDVYFHPQIDGYPEGEVVGYLLESSSFGEELHTTLEEAISEAKAKSAFYAGVEGEEVWEEVVIVRDRLGEEEQDTPLITVKFDAGKMEWAY